MGVVGVGQARIGDEGRNDVAVMEITDRASRADNNEDEQYTELRTLRQSKRYVH